MDLSDQRLAIPCQREEDVPVILWSPPPGHPLPLHKELDGIAHRPACQSERPGTLLEITPRVFFDIEQNPRLARCDPEGK